MKNIDPKSLIIGVLATALVFACTDSGNQPSLVNNANAATGVNDKWDDKQEWEVTFVAWPTSKSKILIKDGWEPFHSVASTVYVRRRVK